ncbi:MAG: ParB/RepB/Spo0J family partition protein [Planctomycetota bacterium]|nr:ParB/RepB/Spo0J family partition protein [Planctomycetota bacterium]
MTTNHNKKRRLGRGLEALLNPTPGAASPESDAFGNEGPAKILPMRTAPLPSNEDEESASTASDVPDIQDLVFLNVHEIERNPFQPRREFSEAELASLSESLKEHDMLQPILVREVESGYQIISGERRWRAAQLAGWDRIPARLRIADDRLVAELAIVENLQRKDLNPLEKAMSFRRYLDEHDCSQEDLAGRLKIDRSTISNLMRLLDLPEIVQDALRIGSISAGHARALLPLGVESSQVQMCNTIRKEGWSVRETERRVHQQIADEDSLGETSASTTVKRSSTPPQIKALEQQLRRALGTTVEIKATRRGKGKIMVHFNNNDEFIRIRDFLTQDSEVHDLRRAG